jgi:hypothetical protein
MRHLALTLAAALAVSACTIEAGGSVGRASDEWTRTYPVAAGGSIWILNVNGAIDVERADGAAVEVRAERIARAFDDAAAKNVLAKVEMREQVAPSSIRVEVHYPNGWSFGQSHQVRFHVKIPDGLRAYFSTTNGKVTLANVKGELTGRTTNGAVQALRVSGSLDARTTNGRLDIEMMDVTGDLSLRTTNGGIRLRLPASTRADVDVSCTNGSVDIDNLPYDGGMSRRRASGRINGGGQARISARTTNGGVHVTGGRT